MIGQKDLINKLVHQIQNEQFPRFSLITGKEGSGKRLIVNEIIYKTFKEVDTDTSIYILPDIKIDTIRTMINQCYKTRNTTLYVVPNADTMSVSAKNALLKITEEPPNNAYVIMTLEDEVNTLDTIRSRGTIFKMEEYTVQDIKDYIDKYTNISESLHTIILELCNTPGEVEELIKIGPKDFYSYVQKVVDNIASVSGSNAFKIANSLSLKKETDDNKYSLKLFWKAFIAVCNKDLSNINYLKGINITSRYLSDLRIKGINKQGLFDLWLLDIRKEWMD